MKVDVGIGWNLEWCISVWLIRENLVDFDFLFPFSNEIAFRKLTEGQTIQAK